MKPSPEEIRMALKQFQDDLEQMTPSQLGHTLKIWEIAIQEGIMQNGGK